MVVMDEDEEIEEVEIMTVMDIEIEERVEEMTDNFETFRDVTIYLLEHAVQSTRDRAPDQIYALVRVKDDDFSVKSAKDILEALDTISADMNDFIEDVVKEKLDKECPIDERMIKEREELWNEFSNGAIQRAAFLERVVELAEAVLADVKKATDTIVTLCPAFDTVLELNAAYLLHKKCTDIADRIDRFQKTLEYMDTAHHEAEMKRLDDEIKALRRKPHV